MQKIPTPVCHTTAGKESGLQDGSIGKILEMAAPLLMGFLGKQKNQVNSIFSPEQISGVLSSLSGGNGLEMTDMKKQSAISQSSERRGLLRNMNTLVRKTNILIENYFI